MKIHLSFFLLFFSFYANAQSMCGTVAEGGTVTLTAPPGNVFTSITFASYGTPNGSCGSFTIGTCHASNSVSIAQSVFIGQNSASLGANNGVFGDPCGGTFKRLYIEAVYSSSLPLKLTSFSGSANGNTNFLKWQTTAEVNTKQFDIQKSSDGNNFSTIGTVSANNRSGDNNYSFSDQSVSSSNEFYRLKMIDIDGAFVYSSIIKLSSNSSGNQFSVYPNPAKDQLTLSGLQNKGFVEIVTMEGKIFRKINVTAQTQTVNTESLAKGIYLVRYVFDDKIAYQKMIKQ